VRHRELYEAEYSWQELKLDALRQRIGAELANRAPDPPRLDRAAETSPENPPKAGSTG
jgi:hypothetical protein